MDCPWCAMEMEPDEQGVCPYCKNEVRTGSSTGRKLFWLAAIILLAAFAFLMISGSLRVLFS